MRILFSFLGVVLLTLSMQGQSFPYRVSLVPQSIDNLPGIQSFVYGESNGKWLIVGGRLDGLHRRQPWASFDEQGHNNQLIVVDPAQGKTYLAPLSALSTSLKEQLSSTNMEFYQVGNDLFVVGGYGFSATENDHVTYPKLTIIQVAEVIDAVISNASYAAYFQQIENNAFQVCGGKLKRIQDTFYLLGGQKFMGRYNPMGPDHGPGFVQEYTNAVRKFTAKNNNGTWEVNHHQGYVDADLLHRRDYNAESQIMPNGEQGITMFSGVFKPDIDLPYLSAVNVSSTGAVEQSNFRQYYNHYHCAALPIYSSNSNAMHTLFFGGIAQYYDSSGTLVQDDNVPFVNTIARVSRDENGTMSEHKFLTTMPDLMGAGSEFILNKGIPTYSNKVVKLDELQGDSVLVGYVLGGIVSDQPNIFFINTGTQSQASNQLLKVYLVKDKTDGIHKLNGHSTSSLNVRVYPNPSNGQIVLDFGEKLIHSTSVEVMDVNGAVLFKKEIENPNNFQYQMPLNLSAGIYFIRVESGGLDLTQKLIIR